MRISHGPSFVSILENPGIICRSLSWKGTGMENTYYAAIMLVVFLLLAALAVDVGYLYVSDEDLKSAAESSALAGAQSIKQRILNQIQADPSKLRDVVTDMVQPTARAAAIDVATGKHSAVALVNVANKGTNTLTTENDIVVGFWNLSTNAFAPGEAPVNSIQVRTRRTAESDTVGLGDLGRKLSVISGQQTFNITPAAIAAIPARANANFALCQEACDKKCMFPDVCSMPEMQMTRDPWSPGSGRPAGDRYAFTSLSFPATSSTTLSDMICMEMPALDVCGRAIYTPRSADDEVLRDMESMMYNPNVDKSNKEYEPATGKLLGWWVIAPVISCSQGKQGNGDEHHTVTKYALVRISKICVDGATGCKQNNTSFDAPSSICAGNRGLFIDRISCASCGSKDMLQFPGLHPVLVK